MQKLIPVNPETMAGKSWKRYTSYFFAQQSPVLPLVGAELSKAVQTMPICLMRHNDKFVPTALLGIEPEKNLFVSEEGQWRTGYVPSALRGYPFRLIPAQESDRLVLCVIEDSGLVHDDPDGEPFFNEHNQPSEEIQKVMDFLTKIEQNKRATVIACEALEKHEVIVPWPVQAGEKVINGIYKVDETKLNSLPGEAFIELRDKGALLIAYCQLLSEVHLNTLLTMADSELNAPDEDDFLFDNDIIKFQ